MAAAIIVRAAQPEDRAGVCAVLYDTFESTWAVNITPEAASAFRDDDRPGAYFGTRGLLFWVAEFAGEIAGFVDWEADFINALHVRAAHARRGIGSRLMDHAEAQIAKAGFAQVRLETDTFNQRSRAFYASRGFEEKARYPDKEWRSGLTTVLLVKPLA